MNKLTVAAMLALPFLAISQQRAAADGWGIFGAKTGAGCATCNQGVANPGYPVNTGYAANPGCATCGPKGLFGKGGCGPGGCGLGCTPFGCFPVTLGLSSFVHSPPPWAGLCRPGGIPGKNDCCGKVPGPWYLYWPDPRGVGIQTGPAYPNWTNESHFTGSVMNFGPTGTYPQYPSYWYGR